MDKLLDNELTARKFYKFVMPSILMLVFISLYSIVDGMFVANFVGSDALAAINIIMPISGLILGISLMFASGSSAIVAILLGEGKKDEACEKFTLICIIAFVVGVIFGAIGFIFIDKVILLLGATPRLYEYCKIYGQIMIFSAPFAFLGIIYEYYIRIDGRPGFTLFLYIAGGVTNLVLDYVFIVLMKMEMMGAALATATGFFVTFAIGAYYFGSGRSKIKYKRPKMELKYVRDLMINGSSAMVSELSTGITTLIFNLAVLRIAGEDGVAALSIVLYAEFLLVSAYLGFSMGVSPLISYSYGAKRFDQIAKILKYSKVFIFISSIIIFLSAEFLAPWISLIFVRPDTVVYKMATSGLELFAIAFLFIGINVFASGMFTAYANGKISAVISFSRSLVFVCLGIFILPRFFEIDGVWLTVPFAECITILLSVYFLKKYRNTYHY
ncbi:MAG: MATE family efflux transporter [Eubacteriales bacterium]